VCIESKSFVSQYKTKPYPHQAKALRLSAHREAYALFFEQGTGKSKVAIDTAAMAYADGRINAVAIVAPEGVHIAWVLEQFPAHCPEWTEWEGEWWGASMSKTRARSIERIVSDEDIKGLRVLAMNYDALCVERGRVLLRKFLSLHRTLLIADESQRIKNPRAQRTKALLKLAPLAPLRRILSGTPTPQGPFDMWSQFAFLDESILGSNFAAFKAEYAELLTEDSGLMRHLRRRGVKYLPQIVVKDPLSGAPKYRNLPQLQSITSRHSMRVLKEEVLKDLPPKTYERRYYAMTERQASLYINVQEELRVMWREELRVMNRLTSMLRLREIVGGWFEGQALFSDSRKNPRMNVLREYIEDNDKPTIIWAHFRAELAEILRVVREEFGASAVDYWGDTPQRDRRVAVEAFQNGAVQYFVSNPASGGIGLNLQAAQRQFFYSHSFSLEHRLQAEDRSHRIGQLHSVAISDVLAIDSIDAKILDLMRAKKSIADLITGSRAAEEFLT